MAKYFHGRSVPNSAPTDVSLGRETKAKLEGPKAVFGVTHVNKATLSDQPDQFVLKLKESDRDAAQRLAGHFSAFPIFGLSEPQFLSKMTELFDLDENAQDRLSEELNMLQSTLEALDKSAAKTVIGKGGSVQLLVDPDRSQVWAALSRFRESLMGSLPEGIHVDLEPLLKLWQETQFSISKRMFTYQFGRGNSLAYFLNYEKLYTYPDGEVELQTGLVQSSSVPSSLFFETSQRQNCVFSYYHRLIPLEDRAKWPQPPPAIPP
jgi:hypothetical protein